MYQPRDSKPPRRKELYPQPGKPLTVNMLIDMERMAMIFSDKNVMLGFVNNVGTYSFYRTREDFITDCMVAMPELVAAYKEKLERQAKAAKRKRK